MSRHRNVRSLNYEEECDGYDDVYGHSVEDDFCVSPSTAAEFMYDRSQQQQHVLSTFMKKEHEPNIPEETCEDNTDDNSLQDSSSFTKPALSDVQQAQLYSCLEELRNILGDSIPEHILIDAVIKADFNHEKALDSILCQQEAPKPQREPRKKRDRDDCASLSHSPSSVSLLPVCVTDCAICKTCSDSATYCTCRAQAARALDRSSETVSLNSGPASNMAGEVREQHALESSVDLERHHFNMLSCGSDAQMVDKISAVAQPHNDRSVPDGTIKSQTELGSPGTSALEMGQHPKELNSVGREMERAASIPESISAGELSSSNCLSCAGLQDTSGTGDGGSSKSKVIDRSVHKSGSSSVPHSKNCLSKLTVDCEMPPDHSSSGNVQSLSHLAADCAFPHTFDSSQQLAADHRILSVSDNSSKPAAPHLAANCAIVPNPTSVFKPATLSQLAAELHSPPNSDCASKPVAVSQLAVGCPGYSPKSNGLSQPADSESTSKPVHLSQLAADCIKPPGSSSSSKPFSLSQLAEHCENDPDLEPTSKPVSLSQLAADSGTVQNSDPTSKPVHLSQLAADCIKPPGSSTSSKPISLSQFAAGCENIPDSGPISKLSGLSQLAADFVKPPTSYPTSKSLNLSQLAAACESVPNSCSSSKPISLSQLAAGCENIPDSGPTSKLTDLTHLAAALEKPLNSCSSSKNPINLSQLAADCTKPTISGSWKPISLSQLAERCENDPDLEPASKPVSLSQLAADTGSAPNSDLKSKPTSLSQLAVDCENIPGSGPTSKLSVLSQLAADFVKPPTSDPTSKSLNLSQLAAACESVPNSDLKSKPTDLPQLAADLEKPQNSYSSSNKPISLSQLAADCSKSTRCASSSKTFILSQLAADCGSVPDTDALSKSISLSQLTAAHVKLQDRHSLSKPVSLSPNTAVIESDSTCRDLPDATADPKTTPGQSTFSVAPLEHDTFKLVAPPVKPPPGFHRAKDPVHTAVKTVPPGFENYIPKPLFSPVPFNLSDLAAKHEMHVSTSKRENVQKCVATTAAVSVARPSLFARILCSKYAAFQNSAMPGMGKVQHTRQAASKIRAQQAKYDIQPFDFSTPSPDDIVKTKQKAAFGNPYRARALTDKTPSVDLTGKSTIKQSDPVPRVVTAAGADVTQGVARLTFSASKHATMGFVEPDKSEETKEKLERNTKEKLPDNDINKEPVEKVTPAASEMPKKDTADAAVSKSATRSKERQQAKEIYDKRKADNKAHLNLVVIGHVDAGKSTLMGHVLYQLGFVNKKVMHKHEQEAKKMGKASFAYAWVLDETEEERSRGVTMDIAQTRFETDTKVVTLLDAPGHKDFIPNMITGAAQADVAILVVNATTGEFETGFDMGGQTREHAMLIRSLGVSQLLVAVNKMDTVDWSQRRYDEIVKKLGAFLKQAGFKEADVCYVPCSGLNGENLTKPSNIPELRSWYHGPCVVQQIDKFRPPERPIDKPLRMSVTDIFKGQGAGFSVAGTIQAGCVQPSDKVLVMPQGELATVRGVLVDDAPAQMAFAGDSVILTLVGIEMTNIAIGSIVCDRNDPIRASTRFQARVVIFNIDIPITKGFPVEIHYQSLTEPGQIKHLISQLHKSSGEVIKKRPRCLGKNSNAVVEIEVERPICVELYRNYKDLGRVMLRSGGHTIAAGLVMEIINGKKSN